MKFIFKLCAVLVCMLGSYVALYKEQDTDTILEVEKIVNPDSTQYIFEQLYPGQKPPASLILCFSQSPVRGRYFRDISETAVDLLPVISPPESMCSTYSEVFDISDFSVDFVGGYQSKLVFDFGPSTNIDILCDDSDPTAEYGCQVTEQGYTFLDANLLWFLIGSLLGLVGIVCVEIIYAVYSQRKQKQ